MTLFKLKKYRYILNMDCISPKWNSYLLFPLSLSTPYHVFLLLLCTTSLKFHLIYTNMAYALCSLEISKAKQNIPLWERAVSRCEIFFIDIHLPVIQCFHSSLHLRIPYHLSAIFFLSTPVILPRNWFHSLVFVNKVTITINIFGVV